MPVANTNIYKVGGPAAEIITRLGDRFLIDSDDAALVSRFCWSRHTNGYARAVTRLPSGRLATVYLHRLLCAVSAERPHVDHANGQIADCRRANLRACSRAENLRNQKTRSDNTSGFKGVGLHKQTGKFRARVRAGGRVRHLGLFDSAQQAADAATRARNEMHGEFARHG